MPLEKEQTFVRYRQTDGKEHFGLVESNNIFQLSGNFTDIAANNFNYEGTSVTYDEVKILAPVLPSKVINFGWTYEGHAIETGGEANLSEPFLFLKPLSSLIADNDEIILPSNTLTNQVEMEGEVAIIIGKRGRHIKEENALDYVFGCTLFNDITARDLTRKDPQFTRGKGFDTFGPLGPSIVTGVDPTNLDFTATLNGTVVQQGNTNQMTLSIPFLISWVSEIMTLEPGDVLATGSPAGSKPMTAGDTVSLKSDQIGTLSNTCRAEES